MPSGAAAEGFGTRKKKKHELDPRLARLEPPTPPTPERLATVEHESGGSLPTAIALPLATRIFDPVELVRSARVVSKTLDVPPTYLYGRYLYADYRDPLYGGPLTLQTARRLMGQFTPEKVSSVLPSLFAEPKLTPRLARAEEPQVHVTPDQVGSLMEALSPLAGRDLRLSEALGTSVFLAQYGGVDPTLLAQNLQMVNRFVTSTDRLAEFPESSRLSIAAGATLQGKQLSNPRQVVEFIAPVLGSLAQKGRREQRGLAEVRQLGEAIPGGYLRVSPQTGEIPYAQVTDALASLPADQIALAKFDATLLGSKEAVRTVRNIEQSIRLKETAFQRSWFGRWVVKPIGDFLGEVQQGFEGAIRAGEMVVNLPGHLVGAALGKESFHDAVVGQWEQAARDVNAIWAGKRDLPEIWHREYGLARWAGTGVEFVIQWYLDPLIVGGKAITAARMASVAPELAQAHKLTLIGRALHPLGEAGERGLALLKAKGLGEVPEAFALQGAIDRQITKGFAKDLAQTQVYTTAVSKFVDKHAEDLTKLVYSPDDTALTKRLHKFTTNLEERSAFDEHYMEMVRQGIKFMFDRPTPEAVQTMRDALFAHFTFTPPPDSLAGFWYQQREWIGSFVKHRAMDEATAFRREAEKGQALLRRQAAEELRSHIGKTRLLEDSLRQVMEGHASFKGKVRAIRKLLGEERFADVRPFLVDTDLDRLAADIAQHLPEGGMLQRLIFGPTLRGARTRVGMASSLMGELRDVLNEEQLAAVVGESRTTAAIVQRVRKVVRPLRVPTVLSDGLHGIESEVFRAPLRFEVPVPLRRVPGLGLGQRTVQTLAESRAGEAKPIRAVTSAFNINPGQILRMHENPERFFLLRARRWRTFSGTEALDFSRQAAGAGGVFTVAREDKLISILEAMDRKAIAKIIAPLKIPEDEATKVLDQAVRHQRQLNQEVFGAKEVGGGTFTGRQVVPITRPLTRSQLVNDYLTLDPVQVRRILNRFTGIRRRMQLAFLRGTKLERFAPDTVNAAITAPDAMRELGHYFGRELLRLWKVGAVARPAYIFRVVLGDEMLRSLATVQSMYERLLAQETFLKIPGSRKVLDQFFTERFPILSKEGNVALTLDLPRPGQYAREALANPLRSQDALVEDIMQTAIRKEAALRARGEWGLLNPVNADPAAHLAAWRHALNRVLGYPPAGREALSSIARGESQAETARRLEEFAKTKEGKAELASVGVKQQDVGEWANDLSGLAHYYTLSRPQLARTALLHEVEEPILAQTERANRPFVHGPLLERVSGARNPDFYRRGVDTWYKWMVRQPEEVLNRQPFYKIWKRRAERSMTEMFRGSQEEARRLGQSVPEFTPAIREQIDGASKEFALAQGKAIMFDFTENSRIGEMVSFVAPFVQPFVENIAVWGHIIARRNPAMLGYIHLLWEMGRDSGFIKKDPDTGEYVIPLNWWAFGAPVLAMSKVFHKGGWSLSAPLNSLNLFWNTPLDVPIGGTDVPIPVPSLAPWAMAPLQAFFKDTRNETLASYLFSFGYPTGGTKGFILQSLLPTWVRNAATAAFPGLYEQPIDSYADDFLKLQQYMGLDPDPKMARAQAQKMFEFKAFFSFAFPASPRIEYPFADVEQQYQDRVAKVGFDQARDEFLTSHPDLWLFTIGKTFWGRQLAGQSVPRIPSTEAAQRILKQPGFREFAQQHPAFASALILSSQDKFDINAFSAQLASGEIKYRSPEQFLEQGEQTPFWDAVTKIEKGFEHRFDVLRQNGLYTDNQKWIDTEAERERALLKAYQLYPTTGRKYLALKTDPSTGETIGATFQPPDGEAGKFEHIVLPEVRAVLQIPMVRDFPAIQGLREYMQGRDRILEEMTKKGVVSLSSDSAVDTGIRQEYRQLVIRTAGIDPYPQEQEPVVTEGKAAPRATPSDQPLEQTPFAQFYQTFFRSDLASVETEGDRLLRRWRTSKPEIHDAFVKFDTQYENLGDQLDNVSSAHEQYDLYQRQRELIDHVWRTQGKGFAMLWWKKKTYAERQDYLSSLRARSPMFWSRADWNLMDVGLSNQAATALKKIGRDRVYIASLSDLPGDTSDKRSERYTQENIFATAQAKKDPSFRKALDVINTWGAPLELAGFDKQGGKVGYAWKATLAVAHQLQGWADANDVHGETYSPEYHRAKVVIRDYIDGLRKWSPAFDAQFVEWQNASRDLFIDWLVPSVYFRLGS